MGGILSGRVESFQLDGKVAVVTGGGSGIGAAIARRFSASGASVQVLDLDLPAAKLVAGEISDQGQSATAWACDVSDQKNVDSVFQNILRGQPGIHGERRLVL